VSAERYGRVRLTLSREIDVRYGAPLSDDLGGEVGGLAEMVGTPYAVVAGPYPEGSGRAFVDGGLAATGGHD
jgi:hypothetical protein